MLTLVLLHMEDFVSFHAKRWINNKLGVTGRHTLLLEGKLKSIAFRTLLTLKGWASNLSYLVLTMYNIEEMLNGYCVFDKLETTSLCVVVSYAYLVFSKPPMCLHQAM